MEENDLSEMIKNVSKMVNDGNIPDEIKNIINNLNSNKDSKENTSSETSTFSNNIDLNTILKMKSIFDKMNNSEDPRSNLLRSLKPYLKESRKAKIDQYIQLFNMSKVIELLNPDGGETKK